MVIFNSYVKLPEGTPVASGYHQSLESLADPSYVKGMDLWI